MDFYQIIKDFGFPAFVALFVLVRLEPAIREQTRVIRDLKDLLLCLNGGTLSELRSIELERQQTLKRAGLP